jgi:hypothetical protein
MSDERDFEQQLQGMAADAARRSQLHSGAEIRRRAARRRSMQVAASGVATVLVVVGVWAVAAPGSDDAAVVPAGPSERTSTAPQQSDGTSPSQPDDSTEPPESPPTPGDNPTPGETTGLEPGPGDWVTTLPDYLPLVLPHWGATSEFEEESDWGPLETTDSWLMVPCEDAPGYASDVTRTAHVAIIQTGIELARAEQIAVYPSDVEAIQAMVELRRALVDCAETTIESEFDDTYRESFWDYADAIDVTSAGALAPDEAFQSWNWNRTYDQQGNPVYGLGGGFFTVTRVGNAIFLSMSDGETDWAAPGAVEDASVPEATTTRGVLRYLCERYSATHC